MAITAISAAQTIYAADALFHPVGAADAYDLARLADGSIAMIGQNIKNVGGSTFEFVTVVAPTNSSHAPVKYVQGALQGVEVHATVTAGSNGGFVVNWDTFTEGNVTGNSFLRAFTGAGNPIGVTKPHSVNNNLMELAPTALLLANGNYLVTWTDSNASGLVGLDLDIMGRIFNPSGVPLGGEFHLSSTLGQQGGSATAGLPDGRGLVTWIEGNQTVLSDGTVTGADTGLKGRFVSPTGQLGPVEFSIDTIGPAAGHKMEYADLQAVALGNGNFVVAWTEEASETANIAGIGRVSFQVFNAQGAKVGVQHDVAAANSPHDAELVELANGGFAVLWQEPGARLGSVRSAVKTYNMDGGEVGTKTVLSQGGDPLGSKLYHVYDLALMADGKVLAAGTANGTSAGSDAATQIFDFGDERLVGNNAANTLYGKNGVHDVILGLAGADTIKGLSGNDELHGGLGNDVLTGGAGADSFVFDTTLNGISNLDRITDFYAPADTIKLDRTVFTAFVGTAAGTALDPTAFWSSATGLAHDADDRIIYNTATGALTYDSNGDAAGGAVAFAMLAPHLALTNADIVIL